MNAFLRDVAGVLEIDSVALDDDFRQTEGWCSLHGFGLLVMLENDWATPLGVRRFLELKTVRDLYREAFISFAAQVLGVGRDSLSGETAYGSLAAWDSVAHLRLVMEAEKRFGVRYELERIPAMLKLDDFLVA